MYIPQYKKMNQVVQTQNKNVVKKTPIKKFSVEHGDEFFEEFENSESE